MWVRPRTGDLVAGRYRVERQIDSGGMGAVWLAQDENLDRPVALKLAHPGADERRLRQLSREARIAGSIDHPRIVKLYDLVIEDTSTWLVMEYVPSRNLADIIADDGVLAPEKAARIGWQLADALAVVHALGIVHGDVKPGNVLITESGDAKLTDFGVARLVWGDETLSEDDMFHGTPAYLAPEVARGTGALPASDVFSLGATLFAATEGVSPLGGGENPLTAIWRSASGQVAAPRQGPLGDVLSAMLQPDPEARPDAAAAKRLLRKVTETDGLHIHIHSVSYPTLPGTETASLTAAARWRENARRLLVALADATRAFHPPRRVPEVRIVRRLLIALADAAPAFNRSAVVTRSAPVRPPWSARPGDSALPSAWQLNPTTGIAFRRSTLGRRWRRLRVAAITAVLAVAVAADVEMTLRMPTEPGRQSLPIIHSKVSHDAALIDVIATDVDGSIYGPPSGSPANGSQSSGGDLRMVVAKSGESFSLTWTFLNAGSVVWRDRFLSWSISNEPQQCRLLGSGRMRLPETRPGEWARVSRSFTGPKISNNPGSISCVLSWNIIDPSGSTLYSTRRPLHVEIVYRGPRPR